MSFVSASNGGRFAATGRTVTLRLGTVPPNGQSLTLTVRAAPRTKAETQVYDQAEFQADHGRTAVRRVRDDYHRASRRR